MVYYSGLYFSLLSGKEHRDLAWDQIELVEPANNVPFLLCNENTSKNNAGGLAKRKVTPKQVKQHANATNPSRCFVKLFTLYQDHCPPPSRRKTNTFYLAPIRKPKTTMAITRFAKRSNDSAKRPVSRVFKTNHPLRVSNATRLFQSGVDEQLIMTRTGHRSVQGVCQACLGGSEASAFLYAQCCHQWTRSSTGWEKSQSRSAVRLYKWYSYGTMHFWL